MTFVRELVTNGDRQTASRQHIQYTMPPWSIRLYKYFDREKDRTRLQEGEEDYPAGSLEMVQYSDLQAQNKIVVMYHGLLQQLARWCAAAVDTWPRLSDQRIKKHEQLRTVP